MKVNYKDIIERLNAEVLELRWIDLDFNQLELAEVPPLPSRPRSSVSKSPMTYKIVGHSFQFDWHSTIRGAL